MLKRAAQIALFVFTIVNANPVAAGKKKAKEEDKEMVVYFLVSIVNTARQWRKMCWVTGK